MSEIIFDEPSKLSLEEQDRKNTKFQPGQSGNAAGRPKKTSSSSDYTDSIDNEDREYYNTDSRKFLERALLKAKTWEDGLKYAKELRMLQHPSLQSVQTRADNFHTLILRWSRPDEVPSNEVLTIKSAAQSSEDAQSKADLVAKELLANGEENDNSV